MRTTYAWLGVVLTSTLAVATSALADPPQSFTRTVGSWTIQGHGDGSGDNERCAIGIASPPPGKAAAVIDDMIAFANFEAVSSKYEIDQGAARSPVEELIASSAPKHLVDEAILHHIVLIPVKTLLAGKTVTIRDGDAGPLSSFDLNGLAEVIKIARAHACSSVSPASVPAPTRISTR